MTWKLNYLVTTLTGVSARVSLARSDWSFDHKNNEGGYDEPDPRKVGAVLQQPIVRDNRGLEYLCELERSHYNPQTDTLILVWKPMVAVHELPGELGDVPDVDPTKPVRTYAGE